MAALHLSFSLHSFCIPLKLHHFRVQAFPGEDRCGVKMGRWTMWGDRALVLEVTSSALTSNHLQRALIRKALGPSSFSSPKHHGTLSRARRTWAGTFRGSTRRLREGKDWPTPHLRENPDKGQHLLPRQGSTVSPLLPPTDAERSLQCLCHTF